METKVTYLAAKEALGDSIWSSNRDSNWLILKNSRKEDHAELTVGINKRVRMVKYIYRVYDEIDPETELHIVKRGEYLGEVAKDPFFLEDSEEIEEIYDTLDIDSEASMSDDTPIEDFVPEIFYEVTSRCINRKRSCN